MSAIPPGLGVMSRREWLRATVAAPLAATAQRIPIDPSAPLTDAERARILPVVFRGLEDVRAALKNTDPTAVPPGYLDTLAQLERNLRSQPRTYLERATGPSVFFQARSLRGHLGVNPEILPSIRREDVAYFLSHEIVHLGDAQRALQNKRIGILQKLSQFADAAPAQLRANPNIARDLRLVMSIIVAIEWQAYELKLLPRLPKAPNAMVQSHFQNIDSAQRNASDRERFRLNLLLRDAPRFIADLWVVAMEAENVPKTREARQAWLSQAITTPVEQPASLR